MDRKELADRIELFCNEAPNDMYLMRFNPSADIDVYMWINYHVKLFDRFPDDWDCVVHKDFQGHIIPNGRFGRYINESCKFDKELYLNPDK